MKKVGIIQSSFLPWRGYFDLIDDVDLFVFYDDVQFTRRDWRNRNKFKLAQGSSWFTVPVLYSERGACIDEIEIDYKQPWIKKLMSLLNHNYGKTRFGVKYISELKNILAEKPKTLSGLNVTLTHWIMNILEINTQTILSRELLAEGSKTERLVSILKKVEATHYLSGPSAKNYIDKNLFLQSSTSLSFKTYDYGEYDQLFPPFDGAVSIFDLLCAEGKNARSFIKSHTPNEDAIT